MKIKILREIEAKGDKIELLMEVDRELLDVYQSETGDYSDPPLQEEFDEWLNCLMECALEEEAL